jgi:Na+/H+ antiporter NhaA
LRGGGTAARSAQLRGWQLAFATSVAVALGLVMVLLKDVVLLHLH